MKTKTRLLLLIAAAISLSLVLPVTEASGQGRAPAHSSKAPGAKSPSRHINYPPAGHQVTTLPNNYRTMVINRDRYHYYNGVFYRPGASGGYVVVYAPLGARIHSLPPGYVSFFIGPSRYFYVNFTYYLWDEPTREYVVVAEPAGAQAAVVTASEVDSGELFVYPNEGQSDEQRDRDRYECYLWAAGQTGYDPGAASTDAPTALDRAGDYRRAISACLEGRGYTVK